jgi:hypothetical protein
MRQKIFDLCEVNNFKCEDFFGKIKIVKTPIIEEFFVEVSDKKLILYHFNYNQEKQTYHGEGTFRSPESVIGYIKKHRNIYDRCNIDK